MTATLPAFWTPLKRRPPANLTTTSHHGIDGPMGYRQPGLSERTGPRNQSLYNADGQRDRGLSTPTAIKGDHELRYDPDEPHSDHDALNWYYAVLLDDADDNSNCWLFEPDGVS